jgi:serralysin
MSSNPLFEIRALNVATTSFLNDSDFRTALAAPKQWGVNTLIIDLLLQQANTTASQVEFQNDQYASINNTESIARIATEMGYKVWIKPIVFTRSNYSKELGTAAFQWWEIKPENKEQWFSSYTAKVREAFQILNKYPIDAFLLGNELGTLSRSDNYDSLWDKFISEVRTFYSGKIGYNAVAFSAENEYVDVTFLDKLDFIGLSTYPQLYSSLTPTKTDIENGWFKNINKNENIILSLRNFMQKNPNLDIMISELGSPATDGGNARLYQLNFDTENTNAWIRDLQEQALFFDVAFELLSREFGDSIMGVAPYRWGGNTLFGHLDVDPNRGIYSWELQGKPAANVIAAWFSGERSTLGSNAKGKVGADLIATGFYDDFVSGGRGNDTLKGGSGNDTLFGNGESINSSQTVKLNIFASGAILNGEAPTVEVFLNEKSVGIIRIPSIETYKIGNGQQSWNGPSLYSFDVPSNTDIDSLKFIQVNHESRDTYINRNFYLNSIFFDDIQLPSIGTLVESSGRIIGYTQAIYQSGSLKIDPTLYNKSISGRFTDDDFIFGGRGQDSLLGENGNDFIDGGDGVDTAIFFGRRSEYFLLSNEVRDSVRERDGLDTLQSIERLRFSDTTIALDINGNAGQAYRLYQAALDRTPDERGLAGWIKFMDDGGALVNMAQQFIDSQEFRTKYGALDNSKFVNQLYLNVLDRNGEPAGIAGWVNGLANGLTRADVLKGFSESTENQANVIGQIKNGIPYVEWWLT